jgi:glutamyl-tRNA synthetase
MYDWLLAKKYGGSFILRIEDTDQARLVPGSLEEIIESLKWLGMQWDEGPEVGGPFSPYFQSERLDLYNRYANQLLDEGKAYRCFCASDRLAEMRKEQEATKQPTGYDRCCLNLKPYEVEEKLNAGIPSVIRFKVSQEGQTSFIDLIRGTITFENKLLDDFVIMKSDGYPTYHFAMLVDDHLMEITHVIRGEEWISSTPKHVLLYDAMGWNPPKWIHPTLILGPDKSKLSKRHGAVRFLDYREKGFLPEAMINFVTMLGWSSGDDQELFNVDELINRFSIEGLVDHPMVFDITKLEWMNGVYIRAAETDYIIEKCLPFLKNAGLITDAPSKDEMEYIKSVISLEKDKLKTLAQVVEKTDFFFQNDFVYEEKGMRKWLAKDYVPSLLHKLIRIIENIDELTIENSEEAIKQAGDELNISGGQVIHPVRMAVTGRTVGPGLFETIATLGKERVLYRLNRTLGEISDISAD